MNEHCSTVLNGILGVLGSAVAYVSSDMLTGALVHDLTDWMKLISFILGAIVSVLTIVKIYIDVKSKKK